MGCKRIAVKRLLGFAWKTHGNKVLQHVGRGQLFFKDFHDFQTLKQRSPVSYTNHETGEKVGPANNFFCDFRKDHHGQSALGIYIYISPSLSLCVSSICKNRNCRCIKDDKLRNLIRYVFIKACGASAFQVSGLSRGCHRVCQGKGVDGRLM